MWEQYDSKRNYLPANDFYEIEDSSGDKLVVRAEFLKDYHSMFNIQKVRKYHERNI